MSRDESSADSTDGTDCGATCWAGPADEAWFALWPVLEERWLPQMRDARVSDDGTSLIVGWRGPVPGEVRDLIAARGDGVVIVELVEVEHPEALFAQIIEHRAISHGLSVWIDTNDPTRIVVDHEMADRAEDVHRIADDVASAHGARMEVTIET